MKSGSYHSCICADSEHLSHSPSRSLPLSLSLSQSLSLSLLTGEYHEDVVWRSVADPTRINARRRTVIVYSLDPTSEEITEKSFVSFKESIWEVSHGPHELITNFTIIESQYF